MFTFAGNLASLVVLAWANSTGLPIDLTVAGSFSVLSLPAVLFDLCLQNGITLARAGHALSAVSIGLHLAELFSKSEAYHRWGLTLITVGFGALTAVAAMSREQTSRLVGTISLFLLATKRAAE